MFYKLYMNIAYTYISYISYFNHNFLNFESSIINYFSFFMYLRCMSDCSLIHIFVLHYPLVYHLAEVTYRDHHLNPTPPHSTTPL